MFVDFWLRRRSLCFPTCLSVGEGWCAWLVAVSSGFSRKELDMRPSSSRELFSGMVRKERLLCSGRCCSDLELRHELIFD